MAKAEKWETGLGTPQADAVRASQRLPQLHSQGKRSKEVYLAAAGTGCGKDKASKSEPFLCLRGSVPAM